MVCRESAVHCRACQLVSGGSPNCRSPGGARNGRQVSVAHYRIGERRRLSAYRLSSARPCELPLTGTKRGATARAPPVNGIGVVSLSLLAPACSSDGRRFGLYLSLAVVSKLCRFVTVRSRKGGKLHALHPVTGSGSFSLAFALGAVRTVTSGCLSRVFSFSISLSLSLSRSFGFAEVIRKLVSSQ